MRDALGYRWFVLRQWKHHLPERLARWTAKRLPRKVALLAFFRVVGESHSRSRHHIDLEPIMDVAKIWERQ